MSPQRRNMFMLMVGVCEWIRGRYSVIQERMRIEADIKLIASEEWFMGSMVRY